MKVAAARRTCTSLTWATIILCILIVCARPLPSEPVAASLQQTSAVVPFVGCKSSGIVEPPDVPKEFYSSLYRGKPVLLHMPAQVAERLAYYKSEHTFGVLAPRGWHCIGVYGRRGATLYVSPQAIDTVEGFSRILTGFTGPAIEIDHVYGSTSGRYEVARVIGRVFPKRKAFVENLIKSESKEGIESVGDFPFGPYPNDKLTYRDANTVEYVTPANTEGIGTQFALKKSSEPVSGVAILVGNTPDLVQLSMRLPPELADLGSIIIQQVKRDAAHSSADAN